MLIGIIGLKGTGKDTAGKYLIENYGYEKDSFASTLKDVTSTVFGWDRNRLEGVTPEDRDWREVPDEYWSAKMERKWTPRLALQLMGTEVFRENVKDSIWVDTVEQRILNRDKPTVITDVRFQNELEMIKRLGGKTIRVCRGAFPDWYFAAEEANSSNDLVKISNFREKYKHIHQSEWDIAGCEVDQIMFNNGELYHLYNQLDSFMTL